MTNSTHTSRTFSMFRWTQKIHNPVEMSFDEEWANAQSLLSEFEEQYLDGIDADEDVIINDMMQEFVEMHPAL